MAEFMANLQELGTPPFVLWWVLAGHPPTLAEAKERLDRLAALGPTPESFTFARAYGPDGLPLRKAAAG